MSAAANPTHRSTWAWIKSDALAGRNDLPRLAFDAIIDGRLHDEADVREAITEAWEGADWPLCREPIWAWIHMFRRIGYTLDGQPAPPPESVPTLYRAAAEGYETGLSWTDSREVAERFADNNFHRTGKPHTIITRRFPPSAVLARFTGREEAEWVIDTTP